jgi:exonuclease SbcC
MLKLLDYSVEFPSTGRSFANKISFEPGLTAITGPNESGKSLIVEMIGYCLFGKPALRGLASDYKNLNALLHLDIKDHDVLIDRQPKMEQLLCDGVCIARGPEAVSLGVVRLLGFNLQVFNITQVARQDELDELTNMRPTARAQMVDTLTGLDALDQTEKECKTEAKSFEKIVEGMLLGLTEPVPPTEPQDNRPVKAIEEELRVIERHQSDRQQLLFIHEPEPVTEPVRPDIKETLEQLREHEQLRRDEETEKSLIVKQIDEIPLPRVSLAVLEKAEAFAEYQKECQRRGPRPIHGVGALDAWTEAWISLNKQGEDVECPACGHVFMPDAPDEDVAALNAIEKPPIYPDAIREQYVRHIRWQDPLEEVIYDGPTIDTRAERNAIERADTRRILSDRLGRLGSRPDRSADLARLERYERELSAYEANQSRYARDSEAYREAQSQLESYYDRSNDLADVRRRLAEAMTYTRDFVRYTEDLCALSEKRIQISDKKIEGEGFKAGAQALKEVRAEFKRELGPSLSKAASTLLYSLTNGERQTIVVDEDFNVWVDKQPLQTLSGSGKAVANLALRIGLGQVLTAKVLSLFIGDEIDGSMDKLRAESTHGTFQHLTKYLDQVILITHKDIEADNVICLGYKSDTK